MKLSRLLGFVVVCLWYSVSTPSRAAGDFDDTHRFVFYAVLEGCYEDGLSTEDVSQILLRPEKGPYMHFVYACPLCTPTVHALEAYQSRPAHFYGLKTRKNTFGPGLTGELKTQLYSSKPEERLGAINALVQRWISNRIALLRLTDAEQIKLKKQLSEMRDKGTSYLNGSLKDKGSANSMSAFKDVQQCAVCNGACGLNLKGK